MRLNLLFSVLCLVATIPACQKNIPPTQTIAISHLTIIDATGAPARKDQTVLLEGERIKQIGPSESSHPPRIAQLVDGRGLYLIPGLWDMHVHVWDADVAFPLFLANGVTGVRNAGGHPDDLKRWRQELREGKRQGPRLIACGPVVDGFPPVHPDHSVVVESADLNCGTVQSEKTKTRGSLCRVDLEPRDYINVALRWHITEVGETVSPGVDVRIRW